MVDRDDTKVYSYWLDASRAPLHGHQNLVTTATPLTAEFIDTPPTHDGETAFTFELRFSEEPGPDFSYETLQDHAFTVTRGEVTRARRLEPPGNVRWEITITPDGNGDVTIVLPATSNCKRHDALDAGGTHRRRAWRIGAAWMVERSSPRQAGADDLGRVRAVVRVVVPNAQDTQIVDACRVLDATNRDPAIAVGSGDVVHLGQHAVGTVTAPVHGNGERAVDVAVRSGVDADDERVSQRALAGAVEPLESEPVLRAGRECDLEPIHIAGLIDGGVFNSSGDPQ